ncbi:MAG: hypothetical protein II865_01420 [Bacteroidales bacterium]|nr:hypothetical protein [Bacteroidales bacterium]
MIRFLIFQSEIILKSYIAGFSTITFYAYGREIRVHGFLQREVREMNQLVEGRLRCHNGKIKVLRTGNRIICTFAL